MASRGNQPVLPRIAPPAGQHDPFAAAQHDPFAAAPGFVDVDTSKQQRGSFLSPESKRVFAALLGEFLGTLFLILVAVGIQANELHRSKEISANNADMVMSTDTTTSAAFAYGMTYMVLIATFEPVSGAHLNPAITVAAVATSRMGKLPGALYITAQIVGAICGSAIYNGMSGYDDYGEIGVTKVDTNFDAGSIFGVELMATFFVVLTWFFAIDLTPGVICGGFRERTGPLYVGMAYFAAAALTTRWDRVGLNPARAFGPASVSGNWNDHWVFWMGPLIGGMSAGLIFELFVWLSPHERNTAHAAFSLA